MKPIPKENLDELIRLTKKYYRTGDVDILTSRSQAAEQLSLSVRGGVVGWLAFCDIVSAILSSSGLKRNATHQDVYDVFALLGYEVVSSNGDENESA